MFYSFTIRSGHLAASSVGCDEGDAQLHCLQTVSVKRLLKTSLSSGPNGAQAVVDGSFTDVPFLPYSPRQIMESGFYNRNVSLILGYNRDEGLLHTANAHKDPSLVKKWRLKWENKFGPNTLLGLEDQPKDKRSIDVARKITKQYVGSQDGVTFENIQKLTDMYTDAWFGYPVHDFVSRRISNTQKIFYQNSTFQYYFTYQGEFSLTTLLGQGGPYGVAHADELVYLFSPFASQTNKLNDSDEKMSSIILSLWKTFVKKGEPSTEEVIWDPILDATSRKYLNLNLNSSMEYSSDIKRNMKFFVEIGKTFVEPKFSELNSCYNFVAPKALLALLLFVPLLVA